MALHGSTAGERDSDTLFGGAVDLVAHPEPSADAQAVALRRQHRMLAARCQKARQAARDRLDIPMAAAVEDAQRPARLMAPLLVQIQRQRHLTLRAPLRLIDMPCVPGAGRIPRVMQLEFEQPQQTIAIQLQAQALELLEQALLRRLQRRADPARGIAANLLAALHASLAADARRRKVAALAAQARTFDQGTDLMGCQELIPNQNAVGVEADFNAADFNAHDACGPRLSFPRHGAARGR